MPRPRAWILAIENDADDDAWPRAAEAPQATPATSLALEEEEAGNAMKGYSGQTPSVPCKLGRFKDAAHHRTRVHMAAFSYEVAGRWHTGSLPGYGGGNGMVKDGTVMLANAASAGFTCICRRA